MTPLGRSRAEYEAAYLSVLSGHAAELVLEDLELTYLYRVDLSEVVKDIPAGANVNDWLDGAAHVVRRLKQIYLDPEILGVTDDDDET